jgi:PAS domain S-box-containing protein
MIKNQEAQAASVTHLNAELQSLAPTAETLRALVDAMPAMIWLGDNAGKVLYFNEQFYSFTGVRREDDDGFSYVKVVHPDDLYKTEDAMIAVEARLNFEFEMRHRGADGIYRWFLVRGVPLTLADGTTVYIGTNTDIDDRKRAEEELKDSEKEFRQLAELIPQLVSVSDQEGRTFYSNQQYYDYIGVKREEDDGYLWKKFFHPDDLVKLPPDGSVPPGAVWQMEIRIRAANGSYRWHLLRAVKVDGRDIRIFATATDIDEQKHLDDEIRESEAHLKVLAEAIPQIVWTADRDGRLTFINQRYYEYTGLSAEQSVEGGWRLLIHPDDLKSYFDNWKHSLESGDTFESTFRLKRVLGIRAQKANEFRKHLCRAVAVRSASGKIIQWFGTWTDVDDTNLDLNRGARASKLPI